MTRHKQVPRSSTGNARQSIAAAAARMMAEDGINDYGYAKRKAARNLGYGDGIALPTNDEVQAELRTYQSLYQDEEVKERLREMRIAALDVMAFLADFRPYLTGPVLDGTAGRASSIDIDLFADSAKDVEISLLSRNIDYRSSEPRRHGPDAPETLLHMEWDDIPVTLAVYPFAVERQRSGATRHDRAKASTVAALLETVE
ncbi:nucleotidyltransferase [Denitratisoma sp. agr-D3]